ncbi:hypothetical protein RSOL_339340, partial [Rhizoctonia solani AG-3 Rhs1AP]
MMNALVNRPDSGGNWDQVHDTACVHVMKAGQLVPDRPLGALFIPAIHFRQNKQPRVSSHRTLPIAKICYLLGTSADRVDQSGVYYMITNSGGKRTREDSALSGDELVIRTPRIGNKQRKVKIMNAEISEDRFADVIQVPERERYPSEEEDPQERELATSLTAELTQLVDSYPIQIIAKAPVNSKQQSWCRLSPRQRSKIPSNFFCSMDHLREAFESYVVYPVESNRWNDTIAALFPFAKDHDEKKDGQGLSTLTVRDKFINLQQSLPPEQQKALVKQVRTSVSERWLWLPYGHPKKHLWATGKRKIKNAEQIGPIDGGPWIVLNPALVD